jgi:hypothetical protein
MHTCVRKLGNEFFNLQFGLLPVVCIIDLK